MSLVFVLSVTVMLFNFHFSGSNVLGWIPLICPAISGTFLCTKEKNHRRRLLVLKDTVGTANFLIILKLEADFDTRSFIL